jgi:hypothetical protein
MFDDDSDEFRSLFDGKRGARTKDTQRLSRSLIVRNSFRRAPNVSRNDSTVDEKDSASEKQKSSREFVAQRLAHNLKGFTVNVVKSASIEIYLVA